MRDFFDPRKDRCTRMLHLRSLTLEIGDGEELESSISGATLLIAYNYFPTVWGDTEQPQEDEDVELLSIIPTSPIWLTNKKGINVSIDGRADLLPVLTKRQIEQLENHLLAIVDEFDDGRFSL